MPTLTKDRAFQIKIAQSDNRIALALDILSEHESGRAALKAFKALAGPAAHLDSVNGKALLTLHKELLAGRRDFLAQIPINLEAK